MNPGMGGRQRVIAGLRGKGENRGQGHRPRVSFVKTRRRGPVPTAAGLRLGGVPAGSAGRPVHHLWRVVVITHVVDRGKVAHLSFLFWL